MSIPAAIGTLDAGEAAFVFFADSATGRGNVLYRRHDGNYGLITPPDASVSGAEVDSLGPQQVS